VKCTQNFCIQTESLCSAWHQGSRARRKGGTERYLGTSSALMLSMFGCPSADVARGVTLHPHGSPALSLTAAASGVRLQGTGKGGKME
jgi:hypothetical protein